MRTETTRLKSESDAVCMVMDEIWALFNKTRGVVMAVTNLKKSELEVGAKLR